MNTVTTLTDPGFCQEIIDLIDGTHWTKGHLETHCLVNALPGERLDPTVETVDMWMYYDKFAQMRFTRDLAVWKNTVPSDRSEDQPNKAEYGVGPQYLKNEPPTLKYIRNRPRHFTKPVLVATYKKAQWCLVGMIMKIADLKFDQDEAQLYDEIDGGAHGRNQVYTQAWRIIDQMARDLKVSSRAQPSSAIGGIEQWNDHESTTKADVRALVVRTQDHFIAQSGEGI